MSQEVSALYISHEALVLVVDGSIAHTDSASTSSFVPVLCTLFLKRSSSTSTLFLLTRTLATDPRYCLNIHNHQILFVSLIAGYIHSLSIFTSGLS